MDKLFYFTLLFYFIFILRSGLVKTYCKPNCKKIIIITYVYIYTEQKYKCNTFIFASYFFMSWTQRSQTFSMYTKCLFLSNISKSVLVSTSPLPRIIHPPHRCGISRCWLDSIIIAQVCPGLATIKDHSKMCSFITQHNATDVASFEGACNWHADYRNVHQSCCPWIECSFLYHKPSPKAFHRIWQDIQPASQPQTPYNHTSRGLHIQHLHLQDRLRPATRTCCNNRFA